MLLAVATSLPELFTGISAVVLVGVPNLTVANLLGANAFNLLNLALLDISYRKGGFLLGSLKRGHARTAWLSLLVVLLVSSLLNAAYFLPIVYKAFFCTEEEAMFDKGVEEAPPWCVVPLVVTAVGSIMLFFYPNLFLGLAQRAIGP